MLFQYISRRWLNTFVIPIDSSCDFKSVFFVELKGTIIAKLYMQVYRFNIGDLLTELENVFQHSGSNAQTSVSGQTAQSHYVKLFVVFVSKAE